MTSVSVYAPTDRVGGVEQVARSAYAALSTTVGGARLHVGPRGIVTSPRPQGPWMSLTWKTHALVTASHPALARPGMLWLHGAELTRDQGRGYASLRDRVLRRSEVLLAVSPLAERLLPDRLRDRVQLVGPPLLGTASRSHVVRARDELRLLSVGRAVPRKGHDTAIEVASCLRDQTAVRLDVLGPGPDLERLRGLARDARRPGLEVNVHGAVPAARRDDLYAAADVLLFLPRHEDGEYEGLGLVVLEAAALGCPAVVLDCGGSRFGLAHEESGLLLDATAGPRELADAALAVVSAPEARERARSYASRFGLSAWQERVRAIAQGEQPDWQWPVHPHLLEESS